MAIDPPSDPVVAADVAFLDARGMPADRAMARIGALVDALPTDAVATVRLSGPPPDDLIGADAVGAEVITVIAEPPDVIVVVRVR